VSPPFCEDEGATILQRSGNNYPTTQRYTPNDMNPWRGIFYMGAEEFKITLNFNIFIDGMKLQNFENYSQEI
jgi:hypothetical protein